jgi:hypothetical protein
MTNKQIIIMSDKVPADDVASYDRFNKVDGATYERVNGTLSLIIIICLLVITFSI